MNRVFSFFLSSSLFMYFFLPSSIPPSLLPPFSFPPSSPLPAFLLSFFVSFFVFCPYCLSIFLSVCLSEEQPAVHPHLIHLFIYNRDSTFLFSCSCLIRDFSSFGSCISRLHSCNSEMAKLLLDTAQGMRDAYGFMCSSKGRAGKALDNTDTGHTLVIR